MSALELRADDPAAPYVAELLAHHLAELASVMGEHAFALDASGLSAPEVTFWTAWRDGALAGFAALKLLGNGEGEVKSMRAAPEARGTGIGRALIDHIVTQARERGLSRLYLETGTAPLHQPAIALYIKTGFVSCAPFANYESSPHNQFMVMELR